MTSTNCAEICRNHSTHSRHIISACVTHPRRSVKMTKRPTDRPLIWGNFKWPYLRKGLSDPLHVWFYRGVFEVGGSNDAISSLTKFKMAAWPPSWKIQMAISPRLIIRFTPCLVLRLVLVFRVFRSNGAISSWTKFNRYVGVGQGLCGRKRCAKST